MIHEVSLLLEFSSNLMSTSTKEHAVAEGSGIDEGSQEGSKLDGTSEEDGELLGLSLMQ